MIFLLILVGVIYVVLAILLSLQLRVEDAAGDLAFRSSPGNSLLECLAVGLLWPVLVLIVLVIIVSPSLGWPKRSVSKSEKP